MISRETIEEILMRTDIESLVSSYVSLKRAGSNMKGLCPFHSEKSPSFTVYPSSNSFYCFGCGAGGDQCLRGADGGGRAAGAGGRDLRAQ